MKPARCRDCGNWYMPGLMGPDCPVCKGIVLDEPKVPWKWTDGDDLLMAKHCNELKRRLQKPKPAEDDPADGA